MVCLLDADAAGADWREVARIVLHIHPELESDRARLKHWLRKAAKRSPDDVWNATGQILKTVSATECSNYFENAGYDQT
jgi:hypothetical protein